MPAEGRHEQACNHGDYNPADPVSAETCRGAVALSAYVSADCGSGYIKFGSDGTVERVTPPS